MDFEKINESFSFLTGTSDEIRDAYNFLKVYDPKAKYNRLVKMGIKSPYQYFGSIQNNGLLIYNGHLPLIFKNFENQKFFEDLKEFKSLFDQKIIKLPFEPYDYQLKAVGYALTNKVCLLRSTTSSGKSAIISLILEYFRLKNLKGVLVVPNINLLTQFKNDIESYGLKDLHNEIQILGNGNKSDFSTTLTISTWQSLVEENKTNFDFIICDEAHRFASKVVSDIILRANQTPIKLGFTGTLPEDPVAKMTLVGLFGQPKEIISAKELIERGLGCPVKINALILDYQYSEKSEFSKIKEYNDQLQYLIEHQKRNSLILKLVNSLNEKSENCLILFQRTLHGKSLFIDYMKLKYPNVEINEENITGKKSFEFQEKYKVYFLNGEQPADIREKIRAKMNNEEGSICFGNYALVSTGLNIKQLKNLIFATPLKAFTTVSQSLGRLMRLHKSKTESVVYDLVDNFGFKKPSGIFWKQYKHRQDMSYIPEDFKLTEVKINLEKF